METSVALRVDCATSQFIGVSMTGKQMQLALRLVSCADESHEALVIDQWQP